MGSAGMIIPEDVAVVGVTAPDTRSYKSPGVGGGQECLNIRGIKAQKNQGFHGGSVVKNLPSCAGDTGSIPGLGSQSS